MSERPVACIVEIVLTHARSIAFHTHGKPTEVTRLEEIEVASPGVGEVVIRTIASPINPSDINSIEGKYPVRPILPATPGAEGSGIVEQVGAKVDRVQPGDLVLLPRSYGAWKEGGLVKAEELFVVPRGIDPIQAAMLRVNPPTALRMLRDFVDLREGDFVLQNAGNSGVGRAVIQIAHALGLRTISLVRRASLIDELKEDGADFVFLDDEEAPPRIALATGGAPIALAFNAVGGESALRLANAVTHGATIVTYGAMSRQPLRIPNGLLIFKDLRWRGFWITPWGQRALPSERAAMFDELFALAQSGRLRTKIERLYPIDAFQEALAHAQQSGRSGKILFSFENAEISQP